MTEWRILGDACLMIGNDREAILVFSGVICMTIRVLLTFYVYVYIFLYKIPAEFILAKLTIQPIVDFSS